MRLGRGKEGERGSRCGGGGGGGGRRGEGEGKGVRRPGSGPAQALDVAGRSLAAPGRPPARPRLHRAAPFPAFCKNAAGRAAATSAPGPPRSLGGFPHRHAAARSGRARVWGGGRGGEGGRSQGRGFSSVPNILRLPWPRFCPNHIRDFMPRHGFRQSAGPPPAVPVRLRKGQSLEYCRTAARLDCNSYTGRTVPSRGTDGKAGCQAGRPRRGQRKNRPARQSTGRGPAFRRRRRRIPATPPTARRQAHRRSDAREV